MPRSPVVAACLAIAACTSTTHQLVEVPRSPEGAIYVAETTTYWPFWFLGGSSVLRCRESAGSRTACTRLRFVVTEQLTAEDCRDSAGCREAGRCTLSGNACIADKAADCEASTGCATNGYCSAVQGVCTAASDDLDRYLLTFFFLAILSFFAALAFRPCAHNSRYSTLRLAGTAMTFSSQPNAVHGS